MRAAAMYSELRGVMADGPSLCGIRDQLPFLQVPWKYRGLKMLSWIARPIFEYRLGMKEPDAVVDVIGRIAPRPVFLIGTAGLETKVVRRYFEFAGEPKTLWEIPEAGHGGGFAARPEEYRDTLVSFFSASLD